jgi:hypothetical protein
MWAPADESLSHSTKDKQFVQTFADELKAEKIEPWICEVDVEFGGNFVAEIEEGLRDADLTVLFWSPEAARSDWRRLEWTLVTAREISESRTRLGVVLLRDCAVPELLRVKHRIDARTDPETEALLSTASTRSGAGITAHVKMRVLLKPAFFPDGRCLVSRIEDTTV